MPETHSKSDLEIALPGRYAAIEDKWRTYASRMDQTNHALGPIINAIWVEVLDPAVEIDIHKSIYSFNGMRTKDFLLGSHVDRAMAYIEEVGRYFSLPRKDVMQAYRSVIRTAMLDAAQHVEPAFMANWAAVQRAGHRSGADTLVKVTHENGMFTGRTQYGTVHGPFDILNKIVVAVQEAFPGTAIIEPIEGHYVCQFDFGKGRSFWYAFVDRTTGVVRGISGAWPDWARSKYSATCRIGHKSPSFEIAVHFSNPVSLPPASMHVLYAFAIQSQAAGLVAKPFAPWEDAKQVTERYQTQVAAHLDGLAAADIERRFKEEAAALEVVDATLPGSTGPGINEHKAPSSWWNRLFVKT